MDGDAVRAYRGSYLSDIDVINMQKQFAEPAAHRNQDVYKRQIQISEKLGFAMTREEDMVKAVKEL